MNTPTQPPLFGPIQQQFSMPGGDPTRLPVDPLSPLSVALSASQSQPDGPGECAGETQPPPQAPGPLAWQRDSGRTPEQGLADAIARFAEKYGVAPTWAEVHPTDASLTAPGVTVFPNRAVHPNTYRVGIKP